MPVIVWGALSSLLIAVLIWASAFHNLARWNSWPILTLTALLLFGPLSCIAYILKWKFVFVTVIPEDGLIISGRRLIEWSNIKEIAYSPGILPKWCTFGEWGDLLEGFDGIAAGASFFLSLIYLLFSLVVGLFMFVLFPIVVTFSPWHSKVSIELSSGEIIRYSELERVEEFVDLVQKQLKGTTGTNTQTTT